MAESARDVQAFFDEYYAEHDVDPMTQEWRALLARENAATLERAFRRSGATGVQRVLELGCGDGALLAELSRRGLGRSFVAYEVSRPAAEFTAGRRIAGVEKVGVFDGENVPEADGDFDLVVISHVIEHAARPLMLLQEGARLAPLVAVQAILIDTLASRRRAQRRDASRTGRLHDYRLRAARRLVDDAGLERLAERVITPSVEVRTFWDDTGAQRAKARAAHALLRIAPPLGRLVFATDWTCVAARSPARAG